MFCLRSWIPLLFIPANASPSFIFLFFVCTYFLNRPCVYCSILLLILFVTSCYWSDRCFFEFGSNWFAPRITSATFETWIDSHYAVNATTSAAAATAPVDPVAHSVFNGTVVETLNTTTSALAGIAAEELARKRNEWTGLGMEWLRSLLGRREWRIECMDLNIRL